MKTKPSTVLRDVAVCVLAALLSVGFGLVVRRHQSPPPYSVAETPAIDPAPLSLTEFRAAVDDGKTLVIDVRDDISYARGHVPRALSLPHRRFDARYAQLKSRLEADRDQSILLYCGSTYCDASTAVQARLQALGYTDVTVFPDGWAAWETAGYPEEKSDAAAGALAPWKNPS